MTGYREQRFDPVPRAYGPPLRPYSWVQWTGLTISVVALLAFGYLFAAHIGWVRDPEVGTTLIGPIFVVGMTLLYSRRDPAPELASARKRWLIITIATCAIIFGIAAVIDFKGA